MKLPPATHLAVWLVLLVSWLPIPAQGQSSARPTRVLVVFGHDQNAPGVVAFEQSLREALRTNHPDGIELYKEPLDYERFGRERWPQTTDYIADKYKEFGLNLIVTEGSRALEFATERLSGLLPGVPIVYGLAFEPTVDFDALPPHVTGRRQPLPFAETFRLAHGLQPDAERVMLVGGLSTLDSLMLNAAVRDVTPLLAGMQLVVQQNWTYQSLLAALRRLPEKTIVILASLSRDTRGVSFNSGDLIPSLTRAASVPVYGVVRNWLGDGIVGGVTMHFADDGKRTGELALRVLRRAPGEPLPPREVAGTYTVADWRQLQRWQLDENKLPANTDLVFRPLSAWQRYRNAILITIGVLAAQTLLILLLLVERRKRRAAQQALAEQAAYEQMIAGLMTDAVQHAPIDAPPALENALARLAQYARAEAASLTIYAEVAERPPLRLRWPSQTDPSIMPGEGLRIPLLADKTKLGVLELQRSSVSTWAPRLIRRLETAADLLAGALARARATSSLEESRGQLAHMARVATVGQLTAAVSHELRQPLMAIRAHAEAGALLLEQRVPDVEEARSIFHDIVRDNLRAAAVIDHMRMLLRKDRPTSGTVDVNAVCRLAAELLQRESGVRGARLELLLDPALPRVRGDAVQLQQLVLNLALNGLDATTLSVGARVVEIGTQGRAEDVEVFVRDTGPGIPEKIQQHLFEAFYSTKPHGLGMGLAIVRAIVDAHRGTVCGENNAGGGAIFRVVLPAARVPTVEAAAAAQLV